MDWTVDWTIYGLFPCCILQKIAPLIMIIHVHTHIHVHTYPASGNCIIVEYIVNANLSASYHWLDKCEHE